MREIGSRAFVLIENRHNPKIYERSLECVLIGYSENSKAYRCYHRSSGKVITSYNVVFIESKDDVPRKLHPGLVLDDDDPKPSSDDGNKVKHPVPPVVDDDDEPAPPQILPDQPNEPLKEEEKTPSTPSATQADPPPASPPPPTPPPVPEPPKLCRSSRVPPAIPAVERAVAESKASARVVYEYIDLEWKISRSSRHWEDVIDGKDTEDNGISKQILKKYGHGSLSCLRDKFQALPMTLLGAGMNLNLKI